VKSAVQINARVLDGMSKNLKGKIFGQDHVVDSVVDMINISLAGLGENNKPIATFLFTGPTGVGKTELAIEIANYMRMNFERMDMSEYADEYAYRNLIGATAGLVGYEEGGLLTNAISEEPHSVLLLDEIEKAHPDICNTFLQVFDYATLKDSQGKVTDFSRTIIIMTSNLGANEARGIGFGNTNIHKESAVVDFLTPEFRNRIDKMLHFNALTIETIEPIVEKFIYELQEKLTRKYISLDVSSEAKKYLTYKGFVSDMGARSVKRAINDEFKKHLSKEILYGELRNGGNVQIDRVENGFTYTYESLNFKDANEIVKRVRATYFPHDFETAQEALVYAKSNPGTVVGRTQSGAGYTIKSEIKGEVL
jgi:ATP-dependent Clp protease ATP-binding subunit ClpA